MWLLVIVYGNGVHDLLLFLDFVDIVLQERCDLLGLPMLLKVCQETPHYFHLEVDARRLEIDGPVVVLFLGRVELL